MAKACIGRFLLPESPLDCARSAMKSWTENCLFQAKPLSLTGTESKLLLSPSFPSLFLITPSFLTSSTRKHIERNSGVNHSVERNF